MNTLLGSPLAYAVLPIAALAVSGLLATRWRVDGPTRSLFQHLAAGVVVSAVAVELLPDLLGAGSIAGLTAGYLLGVTTMLTLERLGNRAGRWVPMGVDLFIDGLLLSIGFATGEKGGLLLLLGLTLETTSLGMATAPGLVAKGWARVRVVASLTAVGGAILAGAGFGLLLPQETGFWFAALLGFGVAALLYLAVEELLTEAHEFEDTSVTTALFFAGFLVPVLLGQSVL